MTKKQFLITFFLLVLTQTQATSNLSTDPSITPVSFVPQNKELAAPIATNSPPVPDSTQTADPSAQTVLTVPTALTDPAIPNISTTPSTSISQNIKETPQSIQINENRSQTDQRSEHTAASHQERPFERTPVILNDHQINFNQRPIGQQVKENGPLEVRIYSHEPGQQIKSASQVPKASQNPANADTSSTQDQKNIVGFTPKKPASNAQNGNKSQLTQTAHNSSSNDSKAHSNASQVSNQHQQLPKTFGHSHSSHHNVFQNQRKQFQGPHGLRDRSSEQQEFLRNRNSKNSRSENFGQEQRRNNVVDNKQFQSRNSHQAGNSRQIESENEVDLDREASTSRRSHLRCDDENDRNERTYARGGNLRSHSRSHERSYRYNRNDQFDERRDFESRFERRGHYDDQDSREERSERSNGHRRGDWRYEQTEIRRTRYY